MFLQVKDSDNLVDVALTIIRNEISSVPIFKSMPDSSGMPLLNLATLQGILKCMILFYTTLQEQAEGYSLLHNQLINIPIGTWAPHTGRTSNRQLRTLRLSSPLNSCLDFLLQDRVSSIPIVDDNGSSVMSTHSATGLIVVSKIGYLSVVGMVCFHGGAVKCEHCESISLFCFHSDIMALAKNDVYARIELEQVTVQNVIHCPLHWMCNTRCRAEDSAIHVCRLVQLLEVLQELSIPGTSLCDLYS
ncbi:hypothetical protein HU200_005721 [Digitaria exilis]|uniref:Uncharacterized protein n=1 Tax=Digitaria exilis TaxID=1010633 RepID=A0A835KSN8_9POAL|nr:hypothetical protein HU200_005721 [Digitaria exilis]